VKGVMRKRLVALLSLAGFASSAEFAPGQVLKGSKEIAKTTSESTIKSQKNVKENHANAGQGAIKLKKNGAAQYPIEHGKEASLTSNKSDGRWKQGKISAETKTANAAAKSKITKNAVSKTGQSSSKEPAK
jgi:hypothetical protein